MKQIKGIVCGLLLVLMLHVNRMPLLAAPEAAMAIADIFTTDMTTTGSQVTLTIGVKKDAGVTSGKIVVSYDESMLNVSSVKESNIWEMEDVNTSADKDGKEQVSYAWVNSGSANAAGDMLTVTFQGTSAASGKEVTIQTDVVELYQGDNAVSIPTKTTVHTAKMPEGIEEDGNAIIVNHTPDHVMAVSENDDVRLAAKAQAKKTGDGTNVAGYVLLLGAATVILAEAVRKKIKHT